LKEKIFVTGASGFIGAHLVSALIEAGYEVVALVRPTSDTARLRQSAAQLLVGDITDLASLSEGLAGCRAAVHLAAATGIPDRQESRRVTVGGTQNLIAACKEQGVERIIAMSTITAGREQVGAYGETKREADSLLLASNLAVTILRPSLVYGPGAAGLFGKMVDYVEKLPAVPVIGSGNYALQPVYVADVAQAVVRCLERPETAGKIYDLVGPDDVTFNQFIDLILAEMGQRKPKAHLPVGLCLLGARALALVMPRPPISVDNIIGMNQETPYDREPAGRDLGFAPLDLRRGLQATLHGETGNGKRETGKEPSPFPLPPSPSKKRIGVVGLGRMGVVHAALINVMPGAELAALADRDKGLARYVSSMGLQAPFYTSLETMLDEAELDGVFICTSTDSHLPLAQQCLERNVGVFVEKPLAESLAKARRMVELLGERQITHAVGYTFGYVPIFQQARQLLGAQLIGPPIRFRSSIYLSQVMKRLSGWLYEPERSGGGVVVNVASHVLFLLVQYFGKARRVYARTAQAHSARVEDSVSAIFEFPGGLVGTLDASWSAPGFNMTGVEIDIEGPNGSLHVTEERIGLWLRKAAGGFPAGWSRIHAADLSDDAEFELGNKGYYEEGLDFVRCLGSGKPPLVSWHMGLDVQSMIDGIYSAAKAKESVTIL
jgi:predicted dehydrogenase/nucleoside-diphosphate-sugar epimerase